MKILLITGILCSVLASCADDSKAPPLPFASGDILGASPLISAEESDASASAEPKTTENPTQKTPAPTIDQLQLTVSCSQKDRVAPNTGNIKIQCVANDPQGKPVALDNAQYGMRWAFSNRTTGVSNLSPSIEAAGPASSPWSVATFTFTEASSLQLLYSLEKGGYNLEVFDPKNTTPSKTVGASTIKLIGETCASVQPDGITFNISNIRNYSSLQTILAGNGSSLEVKGTREDISIGSNLNVFVHGNGSLSNSTSGGNVIVLKGSSYTHTSATKPTQVFTDNPVNSGISMVPEEMIKRFSETLNFCDTRNTATAAVR